ncbi:hypothetical protein C8F04DRAFT_1212262 [Mycena alexandri]|uniref:Integrase n=1 Tax=Mycena alexandri TaxID=1745969 RepID=A0AAD6SH81_9AGAR|nr:hypothetical protein C8F04DRAFT_1212262 [Mycena alexandri]
MPKAKKTCASGPGKRSKDTTVADADTLKKKKAAIRDEFSNAANTKTNYKGYLQRGAKILASVVALRREREKKEPGCSVDGIDIDLLAKAFEGSPNKHSVYALELYMTQKCVVENLGKSTAEGIHGAFAKYWDELPGGKYAGPYSFDEETEKVRGNPARAAEIQSFLKCIKTKARVKGSAATRRHAEATTIEDMRQMMQHSESVYPHEKLLRKAENNADLLAKIKHGMTRAFLPTGHTLWTRNFETCQIQMRDLSEGKGPAPYYLPFLGVFLENHKGWQKKQGYDGPLESNHYDIYEQKDKPEIDMKTHVERWRTLYRQLIGRDFEPDDYLYPFVSPNGTIHAKRPMTHDTAQDLINEFALAAKIDKIFTTHCLRRGGSQYQFMFAPIGERWSLSIIWWWGGWAEGEQVDTLMRYLLDPLQSYESGHGDALYPFRNEPAKSFMGDSTALQPPTAAEFRVFGETILTKLDNLATQTISQSSVTVLAGLIQQASLTSISHSHEVPDLHFAPTSTSTNSRPDGTLPLSPPAGFGPNPPDSRPLAQANTSSDVAAGVNAVVPVPGAIIPGVGKDEHAWKRAVDQWYQGDPAKGLVVPIKDWPLHWYTGSMRLKTGTLYSQRKLLAEELNFDEDAFKTKYPEYGKITPLLAAIRKENGLKRRTTAA